MISLNFNEVLKDLSYKPNFVYRAYEVDARSDRWRLEVSMLVEDARQPMERWTLTRAAGGHAIVDRFDLKHNLYHFRHGETVYAPSREVIEVKGYYDIPFFGPGDDEAFIRWMVWVLKAMEDHETDEWLRYKGELIRDPHATMTEERRD